MKLPDSKNLMILAIIYLTAAVMGSAETENEITVERPIIFQFVPVPIYSGVREATGICLGMVASEADYVHGLHLSTGVSWAQKTEGLQLSGVLNETGDLKGVQICCLNYARKTYGTQIAGVLNLTGELTGTQIGIFNIASTGEGKQIGVFNFAAGEDIKSFGLFNFHRNAWVNLRAEAGPPGSTYLTVQSGLGGYYCSLSAGYNYADEYLSSSFAAGYRYESESFYLEGEGKTTQKFQSFSKTENSAGATLRVGVRTGEVFSFFCGGGLSGSRNDSSGFSLFVPGLYWQPDLSLGIEAKILR